MTLRIYFQPIFHNIWIPIALTVVLMILLAVRPAFATVTRRRRAWLIALRGTVIFALLLAMLRPTVVRTQTRPAPATLAILVDDSRSMQTADVNQQTRFEVASKIVDDLSPSIQQLGPSFEVKTFTFSDALTEVAVDRGRPQLPDEPLGSETDIGAALDDLMRLEAGKRLAGVLLISDGAQRTLAPRADLGQVVRQLAGIGSPLFTVTLGRAQHASETRDVAIENFEDQYTVFAKNELIVRATIRIQGYADKNIPVELEIIRPDGKLDRVGPTMVSVAEDEPSAELRLRYTPDEPGQYQLKIVAAEQPGERITDNNSSTAFLQVLEGGLRVLYLCGNIGWQEHNLIRRSIDQSNDIQLDFRWVGNRRSNWPIDLKSLLDQTNYDVIILADVDADALGTQVNLIEQLVESGKGLLMTGGPHSFGPGGYAETRLANVLPIEMSRFERQQFDRPIRQDVHLNGDLRLAPTAIHFVTRLSDEPDTARWQVLPPLNGANRFSKMKPTATLLLETARKDPILAHGEYGLGRVLAFAGDSTYRWYRHGFQEEHKRFWRQIILWLAKKEDTRQDDVWIRLDQRRFATGARVPFEVGALDSEGKPIEDLRWDVRLKTDDAANTALAVPVKQQDNKWTGTTQAITAAGNYRLDATGFRGDERLSSAEISFVVVSQDLELADPTANPSRMEQLAQMTSDFGGRALLAEQLDELIQQLKERPVEFTTDHETRWQLTDTSADAWLLFSAIVGLLGIEWYLRKKWSMA